MQQLVQFYFIEENVYYSLHEIQKQLSLSTSTISRANLFLFDIGVLQRKGSGTRAQYKRIDLKSFYDNMKPYLLIPIKEYCYIRISDFNQEDVVARSSDSALSFYSSIVEEVPAYVIRKECYQKYKDISIHENEIEEFNDLIRIEYYHYRPEYLKNQFINILDIISIYKDSYDNRIQIEIEELEDKLNDERFR